MNSQGVWPVCKSLKKLQSDEFVLQCGFVASHKALHTALGRSSAVQEARTDMANGLLSEDDLELAVDAMLKDFDRGNLFPHDLTFAALAVVLETWYSEFAERFVFGLADLGIREMPMAIGVAKISAKRLKLQTGNRSAMFIVSMCTPPVDEEHQRTLVKKSDWVLVMKSESDCSDSGGTIDAGTRVLSGL